MRGKPRHEAPSMTLSPVGWVFVIVLAGTVCVLIWQQLAGFNSSGSLIRWTTTPAPGAVPPSPTAERIEATAKNPDTLEVPLASLPLGKARHFEYSMEQGSIRFFVIRTSESHVRAAIDECETCDQRLGYAQSDSWMICRDCGKGVPVDHVGDNSGGCNPIHLHSAMHGEHVVIAVESLVSATISDQKGGG